MKKRILTVAMVLVFSVGASSAHAYGGGFPPIPPVPIFPNERVEKIIANLQADLQKRLAEISIRINKRLDEVRERLSHLPLWR